MKNPVLTFAIFLLCSKLFAQQNLPYTTGFDSTSQTAGWQEYRKGVTSTFSWGVSNAGGVSAPAKLYHDYPVGAATTDTTIDWYVSPALNVSGTGAKLSLKYNVYSITGSATPIDNFSVWYSTNGSDPATANYQKVADLTGKVGSSTAWLDSADIILNGGGTGYLALRYQAINNWFVVSVDDIAITALPASSISNSSIDNITVYPNPSHTYLTLTNADGLRASLYDLNGRLLKDYNTISGGQISITEFEAGTYILELYNNNTKVATQKVTIQ